MKPSEYSNGFFTNNFVKIVLFLRVWIDGGRNIRESKVSGEEVLKSTDCDDSPKILTE